MKTPHTVFQNRRLRESAPRLIALWIAVSAAVINPSPSLVTSKGTATEDQIDALIELVESFGLPRGPENSVITKLDGALAALESSDTAAACDCLSAFINECQARSGKKLTANQSTQLINSANEIKADLGCQ